MRLLVLDHFFAQDLAALRAAAATRSIALDSVSYEELRAEALTVFPSDAAHGLENYARPEYATHRQRYAALLRQWLEDQWARRPFDAFVTPSDTFFYVRAAPQACAAIGVPLLVAQKETTIAPATMRDHALHLARFAPFVGDHMTVCSKRHQAFWVRAGADPATITVTGQPRFDRYAEQALAIRGQRPTVLFLSYMADAYHPTDGSGVPVWSALHETTLSGLRELAEEGWQVRIKPHPQQRGTDFDGVPGIELVDQLEDVRDEILRADVVVGFQTTALLEAMAAGRPAVYTGWDPQAQRLKNDLIPFETWDGALSVVRSSQDLLSAIRRAREYGPDPAHAEVRARIVEEHLGPIDGRASQRTLDALEVVVRSHTPSEAARRRRAELRTRRPPLRVRRRSRTAVRRLRRHVGALLGR